MNINFSKQSLRAVLLSSGLFFGLSVAQAGDYELWREQVPSPQSHKIELSKSDRYTRRSSDALWREQVNSEANRSLAVFTARRAPGEPDGADSLWREQVPTTTVNARNKLAARK